jgi:hypothetical protein
MSKKSDRIVSFTANELQAKRARGETASQWDKAEQRPLPDGGDPDDAMEAIDRATTVLPVRGPDVMQASPRAASRMD